MAYEYTTVQLKAEPRKDKMPAEQQYAEQVNRVSAYGWRLVSVVASAQMGVYYSYFERDRPANE